MIDGLARLLRGDAPAWRDIGSAPRAFLEYCEEEDLTPLVYRSVHALPRHDWPQEVTAELERLARISATREMVRGREITRILGQFHAAGIRPILFKGTALAYSLYPAPDLRPRRDTDLLVPRDQVEQVRALFAREGYVETAYSGDELLFRQFEAQREDDFGIRHAFDVHWEISTQSLFANLLSYDDLSAHSVPVPALGSAARVAGPVEALLIACVHPAMHHRNEERLIWLFDTHLLSARLGAVEWDRFRTAALAKGVAAVCGHELGRARARFATKVPDGLLAELDAVRDREPTAAYLDPSRSWRDEVSANLRGLSSWKDRAGLAREIAFPRPGYMMEKYGWRDTLPARLGLPWLYLRRAVEGTWKVLSGNK